MPLRIRDNKKPPKTNVFRGAADARQMMRKENNSLDAIKMELFYFKMELFYCDETEFLRLDSRLARRISNAWKSFSDLTPIASSSLRK